MGFITEIVYLSIVLICFIYLITLIQNSKTEWEFLEIDKNNCPLVSIIVPTLNEENNIGKCLDSLLKLEYPNTEIIVVDGGSTDKTSREVSKYPVKFFEDPYLPEGWIGKSYGCHLGYMKSKGDILLFTDADTTHSPQSLNITVRHLLGTEADLFSMQPFQQCKKWYEYLVSYFYFLGFLAGGPINDINNQYNKDAFLAIGQYMMFTRKGYENLGGHLAVSGSLVEDLALAKLCKEKEMRLNFMNFSGLVSTRMYPTSFSDFYRGFKKSIAGGVLTAKFWRIIFIVFWLAYYLLSPYFLIQSFIMKPNWFYLDYSIGILVNSTLYLAFAVSVWWYWRRKGDWNLLFFLFYPITMLIDFIMILIAIYSGIRGKPVIWKTRFYSTKQSVSKLNYK
jgi:glycosyltransferase involved in cell wall biosynthesis